MFFKLAYFCEAAVTAWALQHNVFPVQLLSLLIVLLHVAIQALWSLGMRAPPQALRQQRVPVLQVSDALLLVDAQGGGAEAAPAVATRETARARHCH